MSAECLRAGPCLASRSCPLFSEAGHFNPFFAQGPQLLGLWAACVHLKRIQQAGHGGAQSGRSGDGCGAPLCLRWPMVSSWSAVSGQLLGGVSVLWLPAPLRLASPGLSSLSLELGAEEMDWGKGRREGAGGALVSGRRQGEAGVSQGKAPPARQPFVGF